MLTLYYSPSCPFCQHVLGKAESLGIQFNLRDISGDSVLREELIARGGEATVPYLVDEEKKIEMYESVDIIAYLEEHYAKNGGEKKFSGLRVHKSDSSCDVCE